MSGDRRPDGGKRASIRLEQGGGGTSLAETLGRGISRIAWRTPLHMLRLRGQQVPGLAAIPADPIAGDAAAGATLAEGRVTHDGLSLPLTALDDGHSGITPLSDHLQSFAWLRDLAAAHPPDAAAIAEAAVRRWIGAHGDRADAAWRPDLWGRRILFWSAYAPLTMGREPGPLRTAVLDVLTRGARHLDRVAGQTPAGLPRIAAWGGVVAAGLLLPGNPKRLARGEAGLARAFVHSLYADGGLADRCPLSQLELVEYLAQLAAVYAAVGRAPPVRIGEAIAAAVPALLSVTLGDGRLSSWQGGAPIGPDRIAAALAAVKAKPGPTPPARDWGYQHLALGRTQIVLDAAPPPVARLAAGACASTLAFEMTDGPYRLIVNCGGARAAAGLPADFAQGLRTTAAHSTLVLADTNSTALHADGSLGRGVGIVEFDRREADGIVSLDAAHDGYVRRHGFRHRRQIAVTAGGHEVQGDDSLVPAGRRRPAAPCDFTIRFHLAAGIEVSPTADGQGALLRLGEGRLWQFRCRGGTMAVEESIWIDPAGRPRPSRQIVIAGEAPPAGTAVQWQLRRAT